jgi:hypothetical protein
MVSLGLQRGILSLQLLVNRKVPLCNRRDLVNINNMKKYKRTMKIRSRDTDTSSDLMTDVLTNDTPPRQWRLKYENYNAARRALFAARAQMG